jgi:hypothetical protein
MKVNIKLLNGEFLVMEMETYSKEFVSGKLYEMFKTPVTIFEYDEEEEKEKAEEEKAEKEEKKEEKYVIAMFTPLSSYKISSEFITFFEQFVYNYSDAFYGMSDEEKLHRFYTKCRLCAEKNGYEPIVQFYPTSVEYFGQIGLFLKYLDGNSNIKIENKEETVFEFVTRSLMNCYSYHLVERIEYMDFYEKICQTTDQEMLEREFENIIKIFTDDVLNIRIENVKLGDYLGQNGFENSCKMLEMIGRSHPEVFQRFFKDIEPMSRSYAEEIIYINTEYVSKIDLTRLLLRSILDYRSNLEIDNENVMDVMTNYMPFKIYASFLG